MLAPLSTISFAVTAAAAALPSEDIALKQAAPRIPTYYSYGGYPRIQTNISWGTPAQAAIPAIFDTGSVAFWTYGPNAIINDGSEGLAAVGPCNKTVQHIFNWPKSTTHSPVKNLTDELSYSYGGNSKIIVAYQEINDTMSFPWTADAAIKNVQVAISNFTTVRESDEGCTNDVNSFDQSILGMAPFGVGGALASDVGPSFRSNLRAQGRIPSNTLSMWMNKAPASFKGTYKGQALFGEGLPKSAYSGNLVAIKQNPPQDTAYIGYYSAFPSLTVGGKQISSVDDTVVNCLFDSGTGQDELPFNMTEVASHSNVFQYSDSEGFLYTVYNGSCASIPRDAVFEFGFPGVKKGETGVVKLPIRSYARGTSTGLPENLCPLALTLSNYGSCVLGAPFFTAAALQFDDDSKLVSIAQGGVA